MGARVADEDNEFWSLPCRHRFQAYCFLSWLQKWDDKHGFLIVPSAAAKL